MTDRVEVLVKKRLFEWAFEVSQQDGLPEELVNVRPPKKKKE